MYTEQYVPSQNSPRSGSFFWETIKFVLLALAVVIPIRYFIAQPFVVSGASMDPTFLDGQYLIVDELSKRIKDTARYDVVVFRYPLDPSKYFIKRVIGLPGETVLVEGNRVTIINDEYPDGLVLSEPYVEREVRRFDAVTITLKDDEFFVMGDNRAQSSDSRVWGPLHQKYIIGTPIMRLTPLSEMELRPGKYLNNN